MYRKNPYSMGIRDLDIRHSLAPFPVWIAFLIRTTGIHPAVMAHVVVSVWLIFLAYMIYYRLGKLLFPGAGSARPFFLCLTALLTIFGDYSFYSTENFLIARSRQGKAALGSIIIPLLFCLFLLFLRHLQEKRRLSPVLWILLVTTVTGACLCTTLGAFLIGLLVGVTGFFGGVVYRSRSFVIGTFLSCIPAVFYVLLYLKLA